MTETEVGAATAFEMLRNDDILLVWSFNRLGCSAEQPVDLIGELHEQGIQFAP